jgi:Ca-activated chloride channel family protein
MKIQTHIILIGAVLLLAFPPLQHVFAQGDETYIRITQVDNSRFPQVTVYISVTNAAGEPLPVDPTKIRIFENGQPVQPGQISGSGEIGPLTTLLVMDVSGSMNAAGKLNAAKAAAQAYVERMRPGDQAGLLTFNTNVTYLQSISTDSQAFIQAVNSLDAQGDTTMFDALFQAAQILQELPGRKAIIVLTDGLDNGSMHTSDQVIQEISSGGLSISTIGLGDPSKLGINSGLDEAVLQSLAARAGGVYGYASDPGSLLALYEQFGRALQSEYSFTYSTSAELRDGLNRSLTVSLGDSASAQSSYNPGGVLPEVPQAASWSLFSAILVLLVGLLFVPGLAGRLHATVSAKKGKMTNKKHISRIKLK